MFNYEEALKLLVMYSKEYYNGESGITDSQYDTLVQQLKEYEKANNIKNELLVGAKGWDVNISHKLQNMYSLDNVVTKEELLDRLPEQKVCMPKLDGVSLSAYYTNGYLEMVLTRGDGEKGKDVSHLAPYLNIPMRVPVQGTFRVEGEAYCFSFKAGEYKNHRNMVAGAIRLQDASIFKAKDITFVVYNAVFESESKMPKLFSTLLASLETWGFTSVDFTTEYVDSQYFYEKTYPFTDGLVYKANNTDNWGKFTSHHPLFAFAFKFPEKQYETTLLNIDWSVGKLGRITPVAILDPVEIEGATVGRASLANMNIVRTLGIGIGDLVSVIRAKSVIPQIVRVVAKAEFPVPILISSCPCCSSPTEERNGLVYCTNSECAGGISKMILSFCAALGIKGLGAVAVQRLVDTKTVCKVTDILSLSLGDLKPISGTANAPKIIESIQDSFSSASRKRAWQSLGIPRLGASACSLILNSGLESLLDATDTNLRSISGVGPVLAEAILSYLESDADQVSLVESYYTNVDIKPCKEFKGTVCITGTMDVPRAYIKETLLSKGWEVKSGVTKNLDYLLVGARGGQKVDKARQYGVTIVDYYDIRADWGL